MRDRMRQRPHAALHADDAPTGPIPRVAVPTELQRPHAQSAAAARAPRPAGRHSGRVLVIIGLAQLMVVLDTTIVNIALPSAQSALGFGTESRQWIVTAYSLAFGALLSSAGGCRHPGQAPHPVRSRGSGASAGRPQGGGGAWARARQLDWPGVLAVSGGLFCLVYGLSNAQTDSWTAPLTVGMFVASAALLVAFIPIEARAAQPLLPLRIVADRNRIGSYLAIGIAFCSMFGVFLFLTYYLQQTLRYSPLMTGVAFLPFAAGIAVSAGLSNTQLVPRLGPRPLIPVGMATAAAGMFWLRHLTESSTYAADVLGPLIVLGLGVGMTFAPAIATATSGVPNDDAGVASAMVNTSQQIGGAVGTAVLSTIFTSALTRYIGSHPPGPQAQSAAAIHGYTVAFSVACGLFLAGAAITAALLRSGRLPADNAGDQGTAEAGKGDEGTQANGDDTVDVAALQRRIAELEIENRYLQEVLHIRTVAASTPH